MSLNADHPEFLRREGHQWLEDWHVPSESTAQLIAEPSGWPLNGSLKVEFEGTLYELLGVRGGLSGTTVCFTLKDCATPGRNVFELYSDIPQQRVTKEEIEDARERCVQANARNRAETR